MECKLSEENTRLQKLLKESEEGERYYKGLIDKKNKEQMEWYHEFEEYVLTAYGFFPHEKGFEHFQDCMVSLVREYCKLKGVEQPKGLEKYEESKIKPKE